MKEWIRKIQRNLNGVEDKQYFHEWRLIAEIENLEKDKSHFRTKIEQLQKIKEKLGELIDNIELYLQLGTSEYDAVKLSIKEAKQLIAEDEEKK